MNDGFYTQFEDKHRGSRELIKSRLNVYLPFLIILKELYPQGVAVDLGCGRGEWLELVASSGFTVQGVDLDSGMVDLCQSLGLPAVQADALEYLKSQADGTKSVISAFHVVEHLSFEHMMELVQQALRVLQPGGLLILETPNPENISVATNSFYFDPTHVKPIPPPLLAFVAEFASFSRVKVMRLQESEELAASEQVGITEVIYGASPDYAVVAQKGAALETLRSFDNLFSTDYGLTLDTLSRRFDARLNAFISKVEQLESNQKHAEQVAQQAFSQLEAVYSSSSWRLTAPMRLFANFYRHCKQGAVAWLLLKPNTRPRRALALLLTSMREQLVRAPRLKKLILSLPKPLLRWLNSLSQPGLELITLHPGFDRARPVMHRSVLTRQPSIPDSLLLPDTGPLHDYWIRFTGHVEGHYSLAVVNRGLAGALEQLTEGNLSFVPYHGKGYSGLPKLPETHNKLVGPGLHRAVPKEKMVRLSIVHHYPLISDGLPAGLRGIIFAWEETVVPTSTVKHIEQYYDVVWAISGFVKQALINSGCTVPVFVVPLGVDPLFTSRSITQEELTGPKDAKFRYLHVSSAFDRKGVDVLLAAYLDTFTASDNVELYIKTFPNPHNRVREQLELLSANHPAPPQVIIDEQPLDESGMLELYLASQAMVLPSRGEGFNLPAAEALAVGLPLITTGYSGHTDFCTTDMALLVGFQFAESRSHLHEFNSCWVEPDPEDLASVMKRVRQEALDASQELEARRQAGMQHIRDFYTWQMAAKGVLQSAEWVKQLIQKPVAKPVKMALISSWGIRCGIAEYAKSLIEPLRNAGQLDLTVYCEARTAVQDEIVRVSWEIAETWTVIRALSEIASSNADVIFIQHHPAFFQFTERLLEKLVELQSEGRVILIELHSVLPLLQEQRLSVGAIKHLLKIDRIIVHKVEDLNYLMTIGLCDNLMLLPLGVNAPLNSETAKQVRIESGFDHETIVLGFFGFALEHKGIDTLIKAIPLLQQATGKKVRLVCVSSVLDERSERYIQSCKALSHKLTVADQVHWHTDYLPIEQCQKLLSATDFILFPYKNTRESASAAVTVGLSTLLPVLVSDQEIFSDLHEVVFRMNGHSAADIVDSVCQLIADKAILPDLNTRQKAWLDSRDWNKLSERLLGLISSMQLEHLNRKLTSSNL